MSTGRSGATGDGRTLLPELAVVIPARDFDILQEILLRVHAQGWRIREVPFHYTARGAGRSLRRIVAFGWAYLTTLLQMWRLRNSVAAADYDHRAFDSLIPLQRYWQRARHRITLGFVRAADPSHPARILDIGCGSSRIIQDLPDAVGLDVLLPKLRFLRDHHRRLVQGTVFALPFPAERFDIVICSEVLEHIAATPQVFHELTRVLPPGGTLILGTPDYGRRLWWILEMRGNRPESLRLWRLVLQSAPNSAIAREAIERIRRLEPEDAKTSPGHATAPRGVGP